jgi:hypothetical protein
VCACVRGVCERHACAYAPVWADQSISNDLPTHPHHTQVAATLLRTCHDSIMAAYNKDPLGGLVVLHSTLGAREAKH